MTSLTVRAYESNALAYNSSAVYCGMLRGERREEREERGGSREERGERREGKGE